MEISWSVTLHTRKTKKGKFVWKKCFGKKNMKRLFIQVKLFHSNLYKLVRGLIEKQFLAYKNHLSPISIKAHAQAQAQIGHK